MSDGPVSAEDDVWFTAAEERARLAAMERPALCPVGGGLFIGGTLFDLPAEYDEAIVDRMWQMNDPGWQSWWLGGGQPPCEVFYWVGGPTRITVRRTTKRVYAATDRAVDPALGLPSAQDAHHDLDALVQRLRERFDLPAPPAWR